MTLERDDDTRLAEEDAARADLEAESRNDEDLDAEVIEVAEIRAEIEETRVEMGGTLNELGDRLAPGHLIDEVKENVREATIGRVEETAKGMSDMVVETIRRNPIPAAMAGAGLALLWMNRSYGTGGGNGRAQQGYDRYEGSTSSYGQRQGWDERIGAQQRPQQRGIGDRAGEAIGGVGQNVENTVGQAGQTAQEVTSQVIDRGQQTAQQVSWRVERFMQASPLAVGAIAVGAGALVGALVPETEQEREMLGEASRQAGEAVRDTVNQAGEQAEQALDETERSVSESGASR